MATSTNDRYFVRLNDNTYEEFRSYGVAYKIAKAIRNHNKLSNPRVNPRVSERPDLPGHLRILSGIQIGDRRTVA